MAAASRCRRQPGWTLGAHIRPAAASLQPVRDHPSSHRRRDPGAPNPHPQLPTHYQLPQQPSQPMTNMVLNVHSQSLAIGGLPPMPSVCQVAHPVHTVVGNGHLMHPMVQSATMSSSALPTNGPLTNGQQETSSNGLQMLRTVGLGKYEFTDPWHPKGNSISATNLFRKL